jgi:hypothetical protein
MVELGECFGMKEYEFEQWAFGYDSAETMLEKLLKDPWLRCVEFNMQGDWDLVEPPRENYGEDDGSSCPEEFNIRLIQGVEMPDYSKWLPSEYRPFFSVSRESMENVWEEMARSLQQAYEEARVHVGSGEGQGKKRYPDMIVFPEWYVDKGCLRDLRQFSMQSGIGILCGLLPYELLRAVPVVRDVRKEGLRCLVNEAVLIVPGCETKRTKSRSGIEGYEFDLPTEVYRFNIRKCIPAVSEVGFLNGLEDVIPNSRWRFASGSSWKCFIHPRWGNFAVAICADVLTPGKWEDLRGFIDHFFILACNQDIDLYEQVTWAKGYELYANAITVNHGIYGGTTVWTPKHEYHKEVFRVRGSDKGLAISVSVPVRNLRKARERQYGCTLKEKHKYWENELERGKAWKEKEHAEIDKVEEKKCDELKHFKTPPPRVRYE